MLPSGGEHGEVFPPLNLDGMYALGILPGEVEAQTEAPGLLRQFPRARFIQGRAVLWVKFVPVHTPEAFNDGGFICLECSQRARAFSETLLAKAEMGEWGRAVMKWTSSPDTSRPTAIAPL